MDSTCLHIQEKRAKVLIGIPEGKGSLARTKCRWQVNIEVWWEVWTGFIWVRIETSDGHM
jgi:hypothetical protein